MEHDEESRLYRIVKTADKAVNVIAFLLMIPLLLYFGYSIWYSASLSKGSFISDELAQYRPDGEEPTLDDLMELNPDVISWITINGTHIDYPVVQGENDSEYLNRDPMGEFSLAGSIFLSSLCSRDFDEPYSMLYGHHIEGGAMFTDVLEFRDAAFFDSHSEGTLWYGDSADRIEIFACADTSAADEIIYRDFGAVSADDLTEITAYIGEISTQFRDIGITEGDRIIAMSTCEDAVSFSRVLLFGRLRPMTEEEIAEYQNSEKEGAGSADERRFFDRLKDEPQLMIIFIMLIAAILLLLLIISIIARNAANRGRRNRKKVQ